MVEDENGNIWMDVDGPSASYLNNPAQALAVTAERAYIETFWRGTGVTAKLRAAASGLGRGRVHAAVVQIILCHPWVSAEMGGERAVARVYPDGLLDFISNRLPLQEGIWSLENLSRPR